MLKISPKEKFMLFKNNQRFCTAPWGLLYIGPDGSVKTCVSGRQILGNLNTDSIEQILFNQQRAKIKRDILQGKITDNCQSCSQLENEGNKKERYQFLRNNYNRLLQNCDIDYTDENEFVLGALDMHWSSVCNLKCVTCWAYQSSSIAKEQGLPVNHLPSDKVHNFIEWVEKNQQSLKEIYLSGGEPLLIKHNQKLLKKIQKRNDLQIRVNSNLMWNQDNSVLKELLKFPNILFTCSADATHEKFEYIRRDAKWQTFLDNLSFLSQQKNVRIRINSVFFVLSSVDLIDTIEFFRKNFHLSDFTVNQCGMGQTHLRCRNLPTHVKKNVIEKIQSALDQYSQDLNLVGQLKNCLFEINHPQDQNYQDYFDRIDLIAGTDWRSTFRDIQ